VNHVAQKMRESLIMQKGARRGHFIGEKSMKNGRLARMEACNLP
jgi:hypothetical protein